MGLQSSWLPRAPLAAPHTVDCRCTRQIPLDEQREGARGSKAKQRVSYYFANNFWLTTSGHYHTKPFLETVEQVGEDRVLFSVDYPYEQMPAAARWFDEAQFSSDLKLKVGRENANKLFSLGLRPISASAVAAFGS